jgi:hypothetical protein
MAGKVARHTEPKPIPQLGKVDIDHGCHPTVGATSR